MKYLYDKDWHGPVLLITINGEAHPKKYVIRPKYIEVNIKKWIDNGLTQKTLATAYDASVNHVAIMKRSK